MRDSRGEVPDADRARLRTVVAAIEREMSSLPREITGGEDGKTTGGLHATWAELVELLALGPAPELLECPECKVIVMRAATRCGHCWSLLSPLTSVDDNRGVPANAAVGDDEALERWECDGGRVFQQWPL